jgi:glutathione synthase
MEKQDLYINNGHAMGSMCPLSVELNPENWFTRHDAEQRPLADLDIILMRKDPPFDSEFIYSTYILELAEKAGVLVANKPASLRDCNEKVFATHFPHLMTPTLVSRRADLLKAFHQEHGDVIFKPLDGMGGSSIFRIKENDPNLSVIIETLTNHGQQQIMAQRFIPDITDGDKRILMINGEPVPYCLARIPAKGETRGNLAAGGRGETRPLSDSDRKIAEEIGPVLKEKGLYFVGLDVIGSGLTEINVTSPTCVREISRDSGIDVAGQLIDTLIAIRQG